MTINIKKSLLVFCSITFLFLVFNNLFFRANFPHGTVILPWNYPIFSLLAFVFIGILTAVLCTIAAREYWSLVLLLAIFTSGVYSLRFPILDEWVTLAALVGGVTYILFAKVQTHWEKLNVRQVIFLLFITHLLFMSIYGFLAYGNAKALRFSIIYLVVLGLSLIVYGSDFSRIDAKLFVKRLLWVGLAYYLVVLVHWGVAKQYGLQPHILEGIGFAGTSYLALINIIVVPVAFCYLLKCSSWKQRNVPILVLVLSVIISILSDSRASILPMFMILIVFAIIQPWRSIKYGVSLALAGTLLSIVLYGHNHWMLDIVDSFISALNIEQGKMTFEYYGRTVTAAKGDAGRFMYVQAAWMTLTDNPRYLFTGVGNYGYFPIAGEYYYGLGSDMGINTNVINYGSSLGGIAEPPRPPAMGAFLVETGLFGVVLLFACMTLTGINTVLRFDKTRGRLLFSKHRLLLTVPVGLILIWAYFGEIQDVVFLYFLIMPKGIMDILSQRDSGL